MVIRSSQIKLSINISAKYSRQPPDSSLSERIIADIADEIETEEQVEKLGRVLGFSQAAINRYLATNRLEGRVTSKGTRDMMFAWRKSTSPEHHVVAMRKALVQSGLVLLVDKYLGVSPMFDGNRL